ncbi:MAG: GNAT family N-acetyltransferase [Bacteroidetes bacterium]|nr:GNAT family N-acetyltransferase [Bacteroidota bacterium]
MQFSYIVHKITNSRDLEFIRNTIEYDDKSQIDLLTSLKQQQALVLGEAFAFSSLIKNYRCKPFTTQRDTENIYIGQMHRQKMTEKFIKSLINKLNKKKTAGLIHLRPLSENVYIAKVWATEPKIIDENTCPDGPFKFYFITNEEGIYVGAVLDMGQDLHWFIDKKYRGQGFLTNAMKKTILFHLFQDREEQKISIDKFQISDTNFKSSEKVALSLGFVKSINNKYLLHRDTYQADHLIHGQNSEITEDRMKELKKHINYLGCSLRLIHSEIEAKFSETEYTEELKELIDEINRHPIKFEDAWFDTKR